MKKVAPIVMACAAGVLALGTVACGKHEKPNFIYMPDMVYQPSFKAQEIGSMRQPVKGTIPRDFEIYAYKNAAERAGENRNPLSMTRANLQRGREMFNVYCIVCHGPFGEGNGSVVPKFPQPPSLQSDKVRNWKDGNIFHVMTMGQNLMPSYASQIKVSDRWAIVHYVRAIQRAKHPTEEDLKAAKDW
ncbi:MAG: cytochrome c [Bacteriovoracia bacterium]